SHVLLCFWSGEELGLVGSSAFTAAPAVPLDGIAAYLNFDMVGRMQDNRLIVQAVGTSPGWPAMLEQANVAAGFDLAVQDDPYQPTDVSAFNQAGVPSLNFFTGVHADYHRPTDTADKINYADLGRIVELASSITQRVAQMNRPLAFAKVEPQVTNRAARAGLRVFTGTIPDYTSLLFMLAHRKRERTAPEHGGRRRAGRSRRVAQRGHHRRVGREQHRQHLRLHVCAGFAENRRACESRLPARRASAGDHAHADCEKLTDTGGHL
ncbi:MAG: M28 family peptidase, partial [Burkholderiales bacterium]